MNEDKLRLVFMGTASFAVPSLAILLNNGYNIAAVITAPDKPAGRGRKVRFSPVKEFSIQNNLTLLQPDHLKDKDFIKKLTELNPDLQIVVAFRMLPRGVWEIPILGTFNLHASLLPQYRGAAPINHAIINGEKETGATTFFIDEKIDTGKIILTEKTLIHPTETAGELHNRLMNIGASLVLKSVKLIESGKVNTADQQSFIRSDIELKPAPKIFREDCKINWHQPASVVFNLIRGLSPVPAAFSTMDMTGEPEKTVKILSCSISEIKTMDKKPGDILSDGKNYLLVFCMDSAISINQLQMEGKKAMTVQEFLRGFTIEKLNRLH
ncbi:MAG: methionyl-tRNA formyltransferase [Bacteroidales bacterium]